MPPYVPRKRLHSPSTARSATTTATPRSNGKKTAVFEAVDAREPAASPNARRKFLDNLDDSDSSNSSSSSSSSHRQSKPNGIKASSSSSSSSTKRRKLHHDPPPKLEEHDDEENGSASETATSSEDDEENEDEENPWDQFIEKHDQNPRDGELAQDDAVAHKNNIEISLGDEPEDVGTATSYLSTKKTGPSKRDRQIRNSCHILHVHCLLFHNYVRNQWLSNKDLHSILRDHLTDSCREEVERWRKSSSRMLGRDVVAPDEEPSASASKGKGKKSTQPEKKSKNQRDWSSKAARAPDDMPGNLTHGDPLLRLLKTLSSFWKKRFTVTAPGLRKQGYKATPRLQKERKAWLNNMDDQATHGERIENFDQFKELARKAEGSRDVGAQLFTALLRAVGIETRFVSNLQVLGFGWSKGEEADPPKQKSQLSQPEHMQKTPKITPKKTAKNKQSPASKATAKSHVKPEAKPARNQPARKDKTNGTMAMPIDLSSDDSPLSTPPTSDSESDASIIDVTHLKQIPNIKRFDRDLPFPVYWTEALSPLSNTWIPVDPIVLSVVANNPATHNVFEPRGAGADRVKQILAYIVAFGNDGTAKDVTTRYMKNHTWPGKTKGVRMPLEKVPVFDRRGKVRRYEEYNFFKRALSMYTQRDGVRSAADDIEDARELLPAQPQRDPSKGAGEETLQGYKNSTEFVLERHLRREEAVKTGCEAVRTFRTGKGDAARDEPVYRRADVVRCKTVESWHKEGREVQPGEQPLKMVPMRAVTTARKREIEAAERESGAKLKQGLYSQEQTSWIVPPPITDGVIPKNAFGNIDVYVPTMVPEGAAHVALRGTPKLCRRMGIDYAEACTGFEFGNRMAVPVLTGVVVAAEHRRALVDAWRAEQEVIRRKEAERRDKLVLGTWKKMLAGLRVIERVRRDYGDDAEAHMAKEMKSEMNKAARSRKPANSHAGASSAKSKKRAATAARDRSPEDHSPNVIPDADPSIGGGFIPEGQTIELLDRDGPVSTSAHDAIANDGDTGDADGGGGGGGFILEDDAAPAPAPAITQAMPAAGMQSLRQRVAAGNSGGGGVGSGDVADLQQSRTSTAMQEDDDDARAHEREHERDDDDDDEGDDDAAPPSKRARTTPKSTPARTPTRTPARTPARGRGRVKNASTSASARPTRRASRPAIVDSSDEEAGPRSKFFEGTGSEDSGSDAESEDESDGDGDGDFGDSARGTSARGRGRGRGRGRPRGRPRGRSAAV